MARIDITNQTEPATPTSGQSSIYVDSSTKQIKSKDDTGTVHTYTTMATEISDTAFGVSWDGVTTTAPSKNAVYDEMILKATIDNPTFTTRINAPEIKATNSSGISLKDSNGVAMATLDAGSSIDIKAYNYFPGTVAVTGTSVTGTSTEFTKSFNPGDSITTTTSSGSEIKVISNVTSDTAMTVSSTFSGTNSGASYTASPSGTKWNFLPNGSVFVQGSVRGSASTQYDVIAKTNTMTLTTPVGYTFLRDTTQIDNSVSGTSSTNVAVFSPIVNTTGSGSFGAVRSITASPQVAATNTANITSLTGVSTSPTCLSGATGTVTTMTGFSSAPFNSGTTNTITNMYGMQITTTSAAGTVTSCAGLAIGAKAAVATNSTLLLLNTTTIPSGTWGIYNSSSADNALTGNLRIGSVTAPTSALDVTGQLKLGGYTTDAMLISTATDQITTAKSLFINNATSSIYIGNQFSTTTQANIVAASNSPANMDYLYITGGGSTTANTFGRLVHLQVDSANTSNQGSLFAFTGRSTVQGTGTVSNNIALNGVARTYGTGTITTQTGLSLTNRIDSVSNQTVAITTSNGITITSNYGSTNGTVTTHNGIYNEVINSGTIGTTYSIRTAKSGSGTFTTAWDIYAGTGWSSAFAGSVAVGSTTAPTVALDVTGALITSGTATHADNLILPKTSGYGIKVDTATPTFAWRDIIGEVEARGSGANDPTFAHITGTNFYSHQFSATVMQQVYINFHIPHDYVPGTDIYMHAHWLNAAVTPNTGNVIWGFEYSYAKGFSQEAFPASSTITVTQASSATRYMHQIAETTAITISALTEPDGIIMVRVYRDAAAGGDTCTDAVFLLTADIHYQSTNIGTKNKVNNFYT